MFMDMKVTNLIPASGIRKVERSLPKKKREESGKRQGSGFKDILKDKRKG